jgi:hypothetical protein
MQSSDIGVMRTCVGMQHPIFFQAYEVKQCKRAVIEVLYQRLFAK